MFAKESHSRALILCPTHRSLFFGVNLWGIASCSSPCALFISKVQINYCFVRVLFLLRGGFSHVYFHIIFITFNSCFCHCSYFWRGTRLDREILNSIKKSVSKGTTPDRNPNSIKKRLCPPLCNSFRHCCFFCDWTDWTARSIWG